jgi:hypothetical protein
MYSFYSKIVLNTMNTTAAAAGSKPATSMTDKVNLMELVECLLES